MAIINRFGEWYGKQNKTLIGILIAVILALTIYIGMNVNKTVSSFNLNSISESAVSLIAQNAFEDSSARSSITLKKGQSLSVKSLLEDNQKG